MAFPLADRRQRWRLPPSLAPSAVHHRGRLLITWSFVALERVATLRLGQLGFTRPWPGRNGGRMQTHAYTLLGSACLIACGVVGAATLRGVNRETLGAMLARPPRQAPAVRVVDQKVL